MNVPPQSRPTNKTENKLLACFCVDPDMVPLLTPRSHFLLAICVLTCPPVSGLFEWLKNSWTPPAAAPPPPPPPPAPLTKDAQFEMMTADEKFLTEAKQLELHPLDSCHYKVNTVHCILCSHLYLLLQKNGRSTVHKLNGTLRKNETN